MSSTRSSWSPIVLVSWLFVLQGGAWAHAGSAAGQGQSAGAGDAVAELLVAPYLQRMEHDGVTILWETRGSAIGPSTVEYGRARLGDSEPNLELQAAAEALQRFEGGTTHRVRLEGLNPATPYFYRVALPDGSFSPVFSFQTAPRPSDIHRPVGFAVVSDSQNNPEVWGRISEGVWSHRPEFVLHGGDLVGTGQSTYEWRDEF